MKNKQNYFDKFIKDLEAREKLQQKRNQQLEKGAELAEPRKRLQKLYGEHPLQRMRYNK